MEGFQADRQPNLDAKIVAKIAKKLGLQFVTEKTTPNPSLKKGGEFITPASNVCFADSPEVRAGFRQTFDPIDLLDYIYAVLHAPSYRERYKEFLKIDFPRVPYPTDAEQFWQLAEKGAELRQLHLLEHPEVNNYITQYPVSGNNVVEKPVYKPATSPGNLAASEGPASVSAPSSQPPNQHGTQTLAGAAHTARSSAEAGNIYINSEQYFANVPKTAWEFYIGGYQPAQKWLKDRKGRVLDFDDILHYQKIIVALTRTAEIMEQIDEVLQLKGEEQPEKVEV